MRRVRAAAVPVAAGAVTAGLLGLSLAGPGDHRAAWPFGVLLLATGVAALAWRRARPHLVLTGTVAVAAAYYLAGFPPGPETVPFLVALFTVAAHGRRLLAVGAAAGACLVAGSADLLAGQPERPGDLVAVAATLAAVVALGEAYRARLAYLAQDRLRAAAAERLRIARELHDAVSHHLTVINLQAEAAIARRETRPELAQTALAVISTASRETLGDIRATLGVIRDPGPPRPSAEPGLADLPRLAGRLRATGIEITASVPEPATPVPAPVERALVRIAQEALANAARHASPNQVRLSVAYEAGAVCLDVVNDGTGPPTPVAGPRGAGTGTGIDGMRQRARALGGDLMAGPAGEGRFQVHARLPLPVPE